MPRPCHSGAVRLALAILCVQTLRAAPIATLEWSQGLAGLASTRALAQAGRSTQRAPATAAAPVKTNIPWIEAGPLPRIWPAELLPAEFRSKTPAELESVWPAWVSRRDAE